MTRSARALALACLVSGFAHAQDPGDGVHRLATQDVLSVRVQEDSSFDGEYRIDASGRIELPVLGPFAVAGLTLDEAAARLAQALEKNLLQRATVSLTIDQFRTPVTVMGAVANPGPVPIGTGLTLFQALSAAGGPSALNIGEVHVVRRASNGLSDRLVLDLGEILDGADPDLNLPLRSSDQVHVPAAEAATILLMGDAPGVTREIRFSAGERVTLLSAIARAGGLPDRASRKLTIRRRLPDGRTTDFVVYFKKILSGREPDVPLEDGDLILVKESFF